MFWKLAGGLGMSTCACAANNDHRKKIGKQNLAFVE
jgi:hypothetical protein